MTHDEATHLLQGLPMGELEAFLRSLPVKYWWHPLMDFNHLKAALPLVIKFIQDHKSGEYLKRQDEISVEIRDYKERQLANAIRAAQEKAVASMRSIQSTSVSGDGSYKPMFKL